MDGGVRLFAGGEYVWKPRHCVRYWRGKGLELGLLKCAVYHSVGCCKVRSIETLPDLTDICLVYKEVVSVNGLIVCDLFEIFETFKFTLSLVVITKIVFRMVLCLFLNYSQRFTNHRNKTGRRAKCSLVIDVGILCNKDQRTWQLRHTWSANLPKALGSTDDNLNFPRFCAPRGCTR